MSIYIIPLTYRLKNSGHKNEELMIKQEKRNLVVLAHTVALTGSHEKYVVKKQGSFPSVTLYSGTLGDNPSRDAANSMYFCKYIIYL